MGEGEGAGDAVVAACAHVDVVGDGHDVGVYAVGSGDIGGGRVVDEGDGAWGEGGREDVCEGAGVGVWARKGVVTEV